MANIDNKYYNYNRMTSIKPLTKFEDIKVGETYHIPPIILYGRRDFVVEKKDSNTVSGKMTNEKGETSNSILYKAELSMRYLVKKQTIKKN